MPKDVYDSEGHKVGTSDGSSFKAANNNVPHSFDAFDQSGRPWGDVKGGSHYSGPSGDGGSEALGGVLVILLVALLVGIFSIVKAATPRQRIIGGLVTVSLLALAIAYPAFKKQWRLDNLCRTTIVSAEGRTVHIQDTGQWAGDQVYVVLSVNGRQRGFEYVQEGYNDVYTSRTPLTEVTLLGVQLLEGPFVLRENARDCYIPININAAQPIPIQSNIQVYKDTFLYEDHYSASARISWVTERMFVDFLGEYGSWSNIRLSNGTEGWIPSRALRP